MLMNMPRGARRGRDGKEEEGEEYATTTLNRNIHAIGMCEAGESDEKRMYLEFREVRDDLLQTEFDLGHLADLKLFHLARHGQRELVLLFEEDVARDFEVSDLKSMV